MANPKNSVVPILVGIKRDIKSLLNAFSSGVTHLAGSASLGRSPGSPGQKPGAEIVIKLESSGKSSFSESKKVRVKQAGGRNSVNISGQTGVINKPGKIDTSPAEIVASPRRPGDGGGIEAVKAAAATPKAKKRNAAGQFQGTGTKSQQALEDKKQRDDFASQEAKVIGRADSFLSKILGAGADVAKNADMRETAGLATLGPIMGAVTEMSQIGASFKDTATGIIDRFRGGKDKASGGPEAQVAATVDVKKAVDESDKAQESRHKQLLVAVSKINEPVSSPGMVAHAEMVSQKDNAGPKSTKKTKEDKKPAGILSKLAGLLMGGGTDAVTGAIGGTLIGRMLLAAAPVILTVAGSVAALLAAVYYGKKAWDDFNDTAGQKHAFGIPENQDASLVDKLRYVFGKKKSDAEEKSDADARFNKFMDEYTHGEYKPHEGAGADALKSSHIPHEGKSSHTGTVGAGSSTLGSLSRQFESGGKPDAVNNNDSGGSAYGTYQMHSGGTVGDFIGKSKWAPDFNGLQPGTPEYGKKWKETYKKDPEGSAAAQQAYIEKTHYEPTLKAAKSLGIPVQSKAIQEVLFSTGVHHGPSGGPEIIKKAFKGVDPSTLTESEVMDRIYNERGRKKADGTLVHFPRDKSVGTQAALSDRFTKERQAAGAIASISSPELPTPAPIVKQQDAPQQVVFAPGQSPFSQATPEGGLWAPPQINRRPDPPRQQSQPRKLESNIPMEFDDLFLTLMAHDLM